MKPESISIGKVREHHRIAERRGMVGRVADHYGADGYMVVDVLFSDGLVRRIHLPRASER